ncbi:protein of unknown function [Chitinophaga costaii]|uniref:DUF4296 domain-containing protein n=1 Tax=Chitinophaga costaii TaxID=1335309 RepID=A0A1C4BV66_9BACT|nr:DUF4296 domain-containing protein [Chitinophaga costaii]SCC10623.1 protein of unknown function [Chitinophaga costaii]
MRKALAFFIILCCVACGQDGKVPGNVLSKEKMANILLDFNLAEAYGRNPVTGSGTRPDTGHLADSLRERRVKTLYAQVLQVHGLTVDAFMKSYHYYELHADRMEDVYKIMNDSANAHNNFNEANRRAHDQAPLWEKWYPRSFHGRIPFLRGPY